MALQNFMLKFPRILGGYTCIGKDAETGINTIDCFSTGNNFIDTVPASDNFLHGIFGNDTMLLSPGKGYCNGRCQFI